MKHHEMFTVLPLSRNALSEKINQAIIFSFQEQLLKVGSMPQAGHCPGTAPSGWCSASDRPLPHVEDTADTWYPLTVSPVSCCCPDIALSGWCNASGRALPDVEDTADVLWEYLLYPVAAQVQLLQVGTVPQAGHPPQFIVPQVQQFFKPQREGHVTAMLSGWYKYAIDAIC